MTKVKFKKVRQGENREQRAKRLRMEERLKKNRERKELSRIQQENRARLKNQYITSLINARYYTARVNMLGSQIQQEVKTPGKGILEMIDGCKKSEDYMRAEYAKMKLQGINYMRNAHFIKKDLIEKYGLTEDDLYALEKDYYDGKIIRESYDENPKDWKKAKFVNTSKDKKK